MVCRQCSSFSPTFACQITLSTYQHLSLHQPDLSQAEKALASRSSVLTGKIACVVKEANEVADLYPSMKLSWTVHTSDFVRFWYPSSGFCPKIFISTSWGSCCQLLQPCSSSLRVESILQLSLTPMEKVHEVGKRHLWWWCALSWWLGLEKLSVLQVQEVTVRYGELIPLTQCLVIPWYPLLLLINSPTSVRIKHSPEVTKAEAITQSACGLIICQRPQLAISLNVILSHSICPKVHKWGYQLPDLAVKYAKSVIGEKAFEAWVHLCNMKDMNRYYSNQMQETLYKTPDRILFSFSRCRASDCWMLELALVCCRIAWRRQCKITRRLAVQAKHKNLTWHI